MTAFSPEVAFGTKTRSSGRAPTNAASAARASPVSSSKRRAEELDRVPLELALQLLVALEHGRRTGAVAAVIQERDVRVEQELQVATVPRCAASSRSLNPRLPRSVQLLQLGGLLNAFGNGLVLPFLLIYLHNERGIGLGIAGLVLATNAAVSLVAGPIAGALVDRVGGKRMLTDRARLPHARDRRLRVRRDRLAGLPRERRSPASATAPSGRPSRRCSPGCRRASSAPATFAMQRVAMNLGIGIGGVAGGFIATESFRALFLLDALTFVAYAAVLWPVRARAAPRAARAPSARAATATCFRHRVFMALMARQRALHRRRHRAARGAARLRQERGRRSASAGSAGSSSSTRSWSSCCSCRSRGSPRDGGGCRSSRCSASSRPPPGCSSRPAGSGSPEAAPSCCSRSRSRSSALGECLHGAVQAPLVADLADPQHARPLHGDLGALVAGRLHDRPRRRRRPARRLTDRALDRDGVRAACSPGRCSARARARPAREHCAARRSASDAQEPVAVPVAGGEPETARAAG